ncbi:hypothetical protein PDIG_67950 [Penicillium digitatum PHI26]|uniref:Zn(2)-C6 fungal-type domain-containing protein n=2 Tax=Penicillium digitatum TaxID=36651 RepID=K9FJQ0_PEND2|nr:hypothetical protein PDIP_77250 [Penicillium digitatum Pd1]EKV06689.1 hypothetical protein PDIP_77250 [Penicillium digitatum Pd1]EKV08462.1 hypothetical protein PDIG_67950 [Penicillium digitatum PHI26]
MCRSQKCMRCRDRGMKCGDPAKATTRNGASAVNQYPFISTTSDAISLDCTMPQGLVNSTGTTSPALGYSTIAESGPVHPDPTVVPIIDAEEVCDRWLRPHTSSSTGQEPKSPSSGIRTLSSISPAC